jgi:glycosyltransferase involved in cell wall biosynthesis
VDERRPAVSVLMPTYDHEHFIRRAVDSLLAQTLTDWELVIVDDGSPDGTRAAVAPYLADPRVRYQRLERNVGLGAALNRALDAARAPLVAYLPSDDVYYPEHLASLVAALDGDPGAALACSGVRHTYNRSAPGQIEGRPLQLVQVMHRRTPDRWVERSELVTDDLERLYWAALRARGRLAETGLVSCEWVNHPLQHHKIVQEPLGGLNRYRARFGVVEPLRFHSSVGNRIDEVAQYRRFRDRPPTPRAKDGLKILIVGELAYNPERVLALEERGHKLYGLWVRRPETWDTAGPLPFGNIEDVPHERGWERRVREIAPDVIYALLNWQALGLIGEVLDAQLGLPLVFHFKEGPYIAQELGLWPTLVRALTESDARILINQVSYDWFQQALCGALDPSTTMVLDGDLPKLDWMTDEWAPRLSDEDGQVHTVCAGRPLGLDPFEEIARAGVHVHFYGDFFHQSFPTWTRAGLATGHMHLHPTVGPSEWVRELSRYDAAWFHVFESTNGGDLRRASWDDLNMPARLGTYAAAGLPWIMRDCRPSRTGLAEAAAQHDIGVLFRDFADLGAQLRDRRRVQQLSENMRRARAQFAFDTHADALVELFRRAIAGRPRRAG